MKLIENRDHYQNPELQKIMIIREKRHTTYRWYIDIFSDKVCFVVLIEKKGQWGIRR